MSDRIATLVSIVPFPITEWKPGIYPGMFELAPSVKNEPEVCHVGDSCYWVEIDPDRSIRVLCAADDIAKAIVEDYLISNLEYNRDTDTMPGIFWKPGKFSKEEVKTAFARDLAYAVEKQNRWFTALVKLADDDWEKTHQHRSITDMQRYAVKALGLERDWIVIPKIEGNSFKKCPACTTMVAVEAILCPNCKCILNKKKYDELKFAEV